MKDHVVYYMLFLTIGLLIMTLTLITYYVFVDANPPIEFNGVLSVDRSIYHPNDFIAIRLNGCKFTQKPARINMRFVNELVFTVPEFTVPGNPIGCFNSWASSFRIPDALPTGQYYIEGVNTYNVNPFAERSVRWKTEKFIVTRG